MKGLERTWKDMEGLERTSEGLEGLDRIGKNLKELNKVQNLEKCDRRQTDRVTDKASTREACTSKK